MDEIESLATREPLNAKTLTLTTTANEHEGKKEQWDALKKIGMEEPKVREVFLGMNYAEFQTSLVTRIGMRGEAMKPISFKIRCGRWWMVKGRCGGTRRFL